MATTVHDPVCHMDIDAAAAPGKSDYGGQTYYFCAIGCKKDFDADPEATLRAEAAFDHSKAGDHGMRAGAKKPFWQFWRG